MTSSAPTKIHRLISMTCKFKIQYVAGLFLFFIFSSNAFAQSYRLNANYFVRSTENYYGHENKIGVLEAGSEFRVIQHGKNDDSLQIEVTKKAGYSNVNRSEKIWIYKGNDKNFTQIDGDSTSTSQLDAGTTVTTPPEQKKLARIKTQAQVIQVPCNGCGDTASHNNPNLDLFRSTAEIARAVTDKENQPEARARVEKPPREEAKPAAQSFTQVFGGLDEEIKSYSESSEVAAMIARTGRIHSIRGTGHCHREVKISMLGKDKNHKSLIPFKYNGVPSIGAVQSLTDLGFKNLMDYEPYKSEMKSSSQAPKGAILVYSSGIACPEKDKNGKKYYPKKSIYPDCGHVEIKTGLPGNRAYVSDYASANAINETDNAKRIGSDYKLIGIMIKPMGKQ